MLIQTGTGFAFVPKNRVADRGEPYTRPPSSSLRSLLRLHRSPREVPLENDRLVEADVNKANASIKSINSGRSPRDNSRNGGGNGGS